MQCIRVKTTDKEKIFYSIKAYELLLYLSIIKVCFTQAPQTPNANYN